MRSLELADWVAEVPRTIGGPGGGAGPLTYFLTLQGQRAARLSDFGHEGRRIVRGPASPFLLRHALTTVEVALTFRRSANEHAGYRAQWHHELAATELMRGVVAPDGQLSFTTPDLSIEALIEVDLAHESAQGAFTRKLDRYLTAYRAAAWKDTLGMWPAVWTVTLGLPRAQSLRRAAEALLRGQFDRDRLRSATEFAFTSLPDLMKYGPRAPIWLIVGSGEGQVELPGLGRKTG